MIYLPAGSVSEQNMLPLIFFFGCFFGHLSLFCHLGLSSCCNLLSHVCQCFFGHMLGDIYSWMLDGYVSTCFFHFWRIFEIFPRHVELLSLCGIFYWAHDDIPLDLGPNLGNFSPVFTEGVAPWISVKPHSAGSEDRTGLILMKIKMKNIMMMKNKR